MECIVISLTQFYHHLRSEDRHYRLSRKICYKQN